MKTEIAWKSECLADNVRLLRWGEVGTPVLLFPTSGTDGEDQERFGLVGSLAPQLEAGKIKVYAFDAPESKALIDPALKPADKAAIQRQFLMAVADEVVPKIRQDCGGAELPIISAGASIGAYHALVALASYPNLFHSAICMSGTFDLTRFFPNFHNHDFHLISPMHFLAYMGDGPHLELLRKRFVVLATGEGKWESPWESWQLATLLGKKSVPNRVDMWGKEFHHDWATWRAMLPKYVDELLSRPE